MNSSTKLLEEYLNAVVERSKDRTRKHLWVFDFDDTLVRTDCRVHVTEPDGTRFDLTPAEFAVYEKHPDQTFDYDDFQHLINPRTIKWTRRILRTVHAHHGPGNVVVLSARTCVEPIGQFLKEESLNGIEVVALANSDPHAKSSWVSERISRDSPDTIEFFDDSHKNVVAVRSLRPLHPNVRIIARRIDHARIASLGHTD